MTTFTASKVRELAVTMGAMNLPTTRDMLRAYADLLEADEKTQAQRGVWVLVPREPTEGMLQAAEDAVDAASNCESTTDDLSAIAYKAALAAAPQSQAAEPFMYTWSNEPDKDGVFRKIPLYTRPHPAQDALGAVLEVALSIMDANDPLNAARLRKMRDAAIAQESGR